MAQCDLRIASILAERGEFAAAGAVYYLLMQRATELDLRQSRRQEGARKSRLKRRLKSLEKQLNVCLMISSSQRNLSSNTIARTLQIPESTVRRYRGKLKKI